MTAILDNIKSLKRIPDPEAGSVGKSERKAMRRDRAGRREATKLRIATRIKKAFEFQHMKALTPQDIVEIFACDMRRVEQHRADWSDFIEELMAAIFSTRELEKLSESQEVEMRSGLDELLASFAIVNISPENVLNDSLFRSDVDSIREQLGGRLDQVVAELVDQFFDCFDKMLEHRFLGAISWATETSCNFIDWQHRIEVDIRNSREVTRTAITRTSDIKATHTATHRVQFLMAAKSQPLDDFALPIPSQFSRVLLKVPPALKPDIRVVSGQRFRHTTKEHCFDEKQWQEKTVERVAVHYDPAVTIGDVVLFAWDEDDSVADSRNQLSLTKILWAACGLAASVTLFLLLGNLNVIARIVFVSPLIAGGAWLAIQAYRDRMIYFRRDTVETQVYQVGIGWILLSLAVVSGAGGLAFWNFGGFVFSAALLTASFLILKTPVAALKR